MEGILVRNLCSSSSATVLLAPPPRPSFLFQHKASFSPSNSTMFPLLSSLFSAPSRSFSSVIYATPDSQLSVGTDTDTDTREWAMQDFYSLRKDVETASQRVEEMRASSGLHLLEQELADLESKAADSSLWDDRAKAQATLLALTDVKDKIKLLAEFKTKVEEAETIVKLTEEMDSTDAGFLEEATGIIKELNKALDKYELTQLLSGPYDKEGAVLSITAGAGGTDAQCRTGLTCFSGCM